MEFEEIFRNFQTYKSMSTESLAYVNFDEILLPEPRNQLDQILLSQSSPIPFYEQNSQIDEEPSQSTRLDHSQQKESQFVENPSSSNPEKKRHKRNHLTRDRKKRGDKNKLQLTVDGYWTKNFLPIAKNPHFLFLAKILGEDFIKNHLILNEIRQKNGITLQDYICIYQIDELQEVWRWFFEQKVLYREIMLSRALPKNKRIFLRLLNRFEQAFREGKFDHIA